MGNDDGEIGGIKEEEEVGSLKGMAKRDQGTSRHETDADADGRRTDTESYGWYFL